MPHHLILGGRSAARARAADAIVAQFAGGCAISVIDAVTLPFRRSRGSPSTRDPMVIRLEDLDTAFPGQQRGVTFVLTQSTYCLQVLLAGLIDPDCIVATANRTRLTASGGQDVLRRGPWRHFVVEDLALPEENAPPAGDRTDDRSLEGVLAGAFAIDVPEDRLARCRAATNAWPESEVAALALASAAREVRDLEASRQALDRAIALAPDWEAAHFENGKFWLAVDDLIRARESFARAVDLMPTFSAAWSNLGAVQGELDDAEAAAASFTRALEHDPDHVAALSNVGVVNRELGRLDLSEAALSRVVMLSPDFAFGHYNLGHTRFLRGDYAGAQSAYEDGQQRDPGKNRRQACRLAVVRFAGGDLAAAEREFWPAADAAPADERADLLNDAFEIVGALLATHPELEPHRAFLDHLAAAIAEDETA